MGINPILFIPDRDLELPRLHPELVNYVLGELARADTLAQALPACRVRIGQWGRHGASVAGLQRLVALSDNESAGAAVAASGMVGAAVDIAYYGVRVVSGEWLEAVVSRVWHGLQLGAVACKCDWFADEGR